MKTRALTCRTARGAAQPAYAGRWPVAVGCEPLAARLLPVVSARRGITLLELLVTVSILLMLMTVVLPGLNNTSDERLIREAARSIDVFLAAARNRAIETGRPAGVSFERVPGATQACMALRRVETPPNYSGDYFDTMVKVRRSSSTLTIQICDATGSALTAAVEDGYISRGDEIRLNLQGPVFSITDFDKDNGTITASVPSGYSVPWPTGASSWSQPVRFEIARRPIAARTPPMQLPPSVVVDLAYSGREYYDNGGWQLHRFYASSLSSNTNPVIILFGPTGAVTRYYYNNTDSSWGTLGILRPFDRVDRVFLLVGKRKQLGTDANWQDLTNLWVTIDPQTGQATTKEVSLGSTEADARRLGRGAGGVGGR